MVSAREWRVALTQGLTGGCTTARERPAVGEKTAMQATENRLQVDWDCLTQSLCLHELRRCDAKTYAARPSQLGETAGKQICKESLTRPIKSAVKYKNFLSVHPAKCLSKTGTGQLSLA